MSVVARNGSGVNKDRDIKQYRRKLHISQGSWFRLLQIAMPLFVLAANSPNRGEASTDIRLALPLVCPFS